MHGICAMMGQPWSGDRFQLSQLSYRSFTNVVDLTCPFNSFHSSSFLHSGAMER